MPQTQKEQLKEEWKEWAVKNGEFSFDKIANFFLSRTIPTASLQALVEKIEKNRKNVTDDCGCNPYEGCGCSLISFNQALSLCKDLLLTCLKENE